MIFAAKSSFPRFCFADCSLLRSKDYQLVFTHSGSPGKVLMIVLSNLSFNASHLRSGFSSSTELWKERKENSAVTKRKSNILEKSPEFDYIADH